MAGQAEKKRAQNADTKITYYRYATMFANAVYFGAILWSQLFSSSAVAEDETFFWIAMRTLLFSGVTYWTFNSINSALKQGLTYEYYEDVFIVNIAVQTATSILPSYYAWYVWWIYLAVPAFALYMLYQMFAPLIQMFTGMGGGVGGGENSDGAKSKTQIKKEQRGQKYKYMKG